MKPRKVTTTTLAGMRAKNTPIAMATAYDATFASLLDQAGMDVLLVGDSLGMVVQGNDNTLGVTIDQMVYHTRCVARGASRAFVVADMPFLSYQVSEEEALKNAGRLIAEGHAHGVKLEGGREICTAVSRLVAAGIPVMGHIGLTPQHVHQLGGFKAQGKDTESATELIEAARALERAGAFAIVLECVPGELAQTITEAIGIPTIGIGAGVHCDGQVLVCYDFLGMNDGFKPRFLKTFDDLGSRIREATAAYVTEVKERSFPATEHTFESPALQDLQTSTEDEPIPLYGKNRR